jgi:uncharacterized membrane protein
VQDEREDAVRERTSAESPPSPARDELPASATPAAEAVGIDEEMTAAYDRSSFSPARSAAASAPAAPDDLTYQDAPAPPPPPWAQHDPRQHQPSPGARPSPHGPFGARPPRPGGPGGPGGPAASNVPWQAATSWGPTTLTLDANTTAGVSYLFWWLSGLLVYFNERHNRYVRFHAVQSILLTCALTVCGVVAYIIWAFFHDVSRATHLLVLAAIGNAVAILAATAILIIWLGAMIAAWTGHYLRFPYIAAYAERYSAPPAQPPIPPAF